VLTFVHGCHKLQGLLSLTKSGLINEGRDLLSFSSCSVFEPPIYLFDAMYLLEITGLIRLRREGLVVRCPCVCMSLVNDSLRKI
jgi:hypothetical protein